MALTWFYKSGDQERGPVSSADLKGLVAGGELSPDHLVRRSDMSQWVHAMQVKGLFDVPPPRVAVAAASPPNTKRSEWYYSQNGKQHGPVSAIQLKELAATGQLEATDLVWTEGQAEWVPASQIKGLFVAPPSAPAVASLPVPIPQAVLRPRYGDVNPKARSRSGQLPHVQPIAAWGVFLCVFGGIWTMICYFNVCSGLTKLNPGRPIQFWTWFIPLYVNIYFGEINEALNEVIAKENLEIGQLQNNLLLNIFFPFVPLYRMFKCYTRVVDELESR